MSDIDIITPHFIRFENDVLNDLVFHQEVETLHKSGSSDFSKVIMVNRHIKMDIRIDPQQEYDYVEYEDFKYKVSSLETILKAKCEYSLKGSLKHKEDIKEICQPPMAMSGSLSEDDTEIFGSTTSTSTVTPKYKYQQTS